MRVPTRLLGFAAALALVFGAAALAGATIGPETTSGGQHMDGGGAHGEDAGTPTVSGLAVTDGAYALEPGPVFLTARQSSPFSFRITDRSGRVVRDGYQVEHEKELHLIVVRRDTAVFEHVHPAKGADGTWSVDLMLREPGVYRAYADFTIGGTKRALATELFVSGDFRPVAFPSPVATVKAVDAGGGPAGAFDVTLEAAGTAAGKESSLSFAVTQGGQRVAALQPYLGAKGHLVALREGDLAYLHVHPADDGTDRPGDIRFAATFPTAGRYRLFLQFNAGGVATTTRRSLRPTRRERRRR